MNILKQYLKGIYTYKIKIPTMFNDYEFEIHNHNLITDDGLNFLFNKLVFGLGDVESNLSSANIYDSFIDTIILNRTVEDHASPDDKYNDIIKGNPISIKVNPQLDNNVLIFSSESQEEEITGSMLNTGINEIGLVTSKYQFGETDTTSTSYDQITEEIDNEENHILVTHDIHEIISDLPDSARIIIEYKLMFNIGNYLRGFTKVPNYNNLYEYTNFNKEIIYIKNLDTNNNYIKYTGTLEEMDINGQGSYKQMKNGEIDTLYVHTETGYSPDGYNIVVYNSTNNYIEDIIE